MLISVEEDNLFVDFNKGILIIVILFFNYSIYIKVIIYYNYFNLL